MFWFILGAITLSALALIGLVNVVFDAFSPGPRYPDTLQLNVRIRVLTDTGL